MLTHVLLTKSNLSLEELFNKCTKGSGLVQAVGINKSAVTIAGSGFHVVALNET